MILGYRIEKSASAIAIRSLIQNACQIYRPEKLHFLTDAGSENVNSIVSDFINPPHIPIKHIVAQKDVAFSNSMIEAVNKIIKHQFLYPKEVASGKRLTDIMEETVSVYNTIRTQMSLGGNTPEETQNGLSIDLSKYTKGYKEQKALRNQLNQQNVCKVCF
jgi:putative transposase